MLTTGWLHGANHTQAILNNICVVFIISLKGQVCVINTNNINTTGTIQRADHTYVTSATYEIKTKNSTPSK
jgi:hypothetical protein